MVLCLLLLGSVLGFLGVVCCCLGLKFVGLWIVVGGYCVLCLLVCAIVCLCSGWLGCCSLRFVDSFCSLRIVWVLVMGCLYGGFMVIWVC